MAIVVIGTLSFTLSPDDNSNQNYFQNLGGGTYSVTCNDATIEVQADLSVPLTGRDISDAPINNLFAVDAFAAGTTNIHLYSYDPLTDAISVLDGAAGSTGSADQFYGLDYHPIENQVYMLNNDLGFVRSLYTLDITTGTAVYIAGVTSPLGDTQPIDLSFDSNGNLYIAFKSGEIGLYDFTTDTVLAFSDVSGAATTLGGIGLTYDFDNDRLLHTNGTGPVEVLAIDITTAAVTPVIILGTSVTAQGIEYVGSDKAIVSCTFGCDIIYSADLLTGVTTTLTNPGSDGFTTAIKDLMYIDFDVVLDPVALDCDDLGVNTVEVTVTDYAGSVTTCTATVTVEDPNDFCALSVNDLSESPFVMFPNPADDSFQVQWNANEPLIGIEIFDILGKSVLTLNNIQAENPVINVATLKAGVYVVKFQTELGTTTARLVKQ
ncbi:MAG: T9SS type A sorting domain-containing protein [Gilvibacter sp.]